MTSASSTLSTTGFAEDEMIEDSDWMGSHICVVLVLMDPKLATDAEASPAEVRQSQERLRVARQVPARAMKRTGGDEGVEDGIRGAVVAAGKAVVVAVVVAADAASDAS